MMEYDIYTAISKLGNKEILDYDMQYFLVSLHFRVFDSIICIYGYNFEMMWILETKILHLQKVGS